MSGATKLTGLLPGLLLVTASCSGSVRPPVVDPEPRATDRVLLETMNPLILTNLVSSSLVVEVDWIAGRPPGSAALEILERTLREHCPEAKRIRVLPDDEIPASEWEAAADGRAGLERLIGRHLDHDPANRAAEELIYVLYAPRSEPWYGRSAVGMADELTVERAGRPATVPALLVFTETIAGKAMLWITASRIERATVVHELGHLLGLVGNPEHVQPRHPAHCAVARCVMNQPGAGSLLHNALPALFAGRIPNDYCGRCREDIRRARRLWESRASSGPGLERRLRERLTLGGARTGSSGRTGVE